MERKYNSYTLEKKLSLLKLVDEVGYHEVERQTGVSRKTLRGWQNNREKINAMPNKRNSYRLKGGGRKSLSATYENEILDWIIFNRKLEISITTNEIIVYACKLIEHHK